MLKIKLLISCAADYRRLDLSSLIAVWLVVILIIPGCNYHLSGMNDDEQLFSPLLKNISVEGLPRYDEFRMQLKENILSYRMKVVAPQFATTRIIVKDKKIRQQAITVGDDAKAREYLLTLQLDFYIVVTDAETKKHQYPMQSIQSETTYAYYPQHVSISLNEKNRALTFLNQDLIFKLINYLHTLEV